MLMKTGSKSAWWLSKCCWMVCTVIISFAALILTGVTLCPMFHYTVRLSGIYVLAAPFCAVLSVSLIGQFITMLGVNPAVTLILLSGSVTLALFVDSPWYIWAASMQTRYCIWSGFPALYGFWHLFCLFQSVRLFLLEKTFI